MIFRRYQQRIVHPPGSGQVARETVTEDVTSGMFTLESNVRGVLETRPATAEEAQWEADQTAELADIESEKNALSRLDQSANVLRQWSSDAEAAVAAWDSASDLQKDQWTKITIDRLGKLTDNLADVLIQIGVRRNI